MNGATALASSTVKVVYPTGMLGAGFSAEAIQRGIEMGADAIAIDGGSTDSGPYYLGTGVPKQTAAAIERDLRAALIAARRAGIPLIVTSCGTSGCDQALDGVVAMTHRIAREENLAFPMAVIYSEQSQDRVLDLLHSGRIGPLEPSGQLDEQTIRSCSHIVGVMGHEPIVAALDAGAEVVLTGRASDTSPVAALALRAGISAGPAWHAAKTVECGGLCTDDPRSGPVMVEIDSQGFTVRSLNPGTTCSPFSVAAHMMYENADPYRLREPAGVLDAADARYLGVDDGSVRVEGSRFEPAGQVTIKLEGSALVGYQAISIAGIRDPRVIASIEQWRTQLEGMLAARVKEVFGLDAGDYCVELRCYGYDAVLGAGEPERSVCHEVAAILKVRAAEEDVALQITKLANPLMLHMPLTRTAPLPSYAFLTSPAELAAGPAYEFVLNHVAAVSSGHELFRTETSLVSANGAKRI